MVDAPWPASIRLKKRLWSTQASGSLRLQRYSQRFMVWDDAVGSRFREAPAHRRIRMAAADKPPHAHSCGSGREHAVDRIFDHHAVQRRGGELRCGEQKHIGGRFAALNLLGGVNVRIERLAQAGSLQLFQQLSTRRGTRHRFPAGPGSDGSSRSRNRLKLGPEGKPLCCVQDGENACRRGAPRRSALSADKAARNAGCAKPMKRSENSSGL